MLLAGKQFVQHVVPAIVKPLRILWNELMAFIFVAFAVLVSFSTWRNYNAAGPANGSPLVLLAGGGFAVMLFYFGVSSFLRARKISRS